MMSLLQITLSVLKLLLKNMLHMETLTNTLIRVSKRLSLYKKLPINIDGMSHHT
jgi:hypothetical protein